MLNEKITFDKFIRWAIITLLVVTVLVAVNYLSEVLLPFFVAWLLAYLVYPVVKFVQYKLHVPTRALSIVIALIFIIAVISGIFYLIIPPMIEQFEISSSRSGSSSSSLIKFITGRSGSPPDRKSVV